MKRPPPGVNRRDLLRLRRSPVETSPAATDLVRAQRPAMGSSFEVCIPAGIPGAVDLACRALDIIDDLELQMTVYRDDSEVSRLNARGHLGPVAVEPALFGLLEQALTLSRETGGAYDVTSGALSEAWGFVRGPKRVPEPEVLASARERTGWHHLRLDPERRTVAFDREGVRINLGSIGKGYAIDRVADLIRAYPWPTSGLVHGGRSSVSAIGSPPGRPGSRWEITLYNPFQPEAPLGTFFLRNRALGTSGAAFQSFVVEGRAYGHILDPRTGEPADGPASVTVLAPTAAIADALSTAFYLLGPIGSAAYIEAHPGIGAVFVDRNSEGRSPKLSVLGLGEYDFLAEGNALR